MALVKLTERASSSLPLAVPRPICDGSLTSSTLGVRSAVVERRADYMFLPRSIEPVAGCLILFLIVSETFLKAI